MDYLFQDCQVIAECPYCEESLHFGDGGVVNGLHVVCHTKLGEELAMLEEDTKWLLASSEIYRTHFYPGHKASREFSLPVTEKNR